MVIGGDIMSTINRIYDDPESVGRHLFDLLKSPNENDDLQGEVNFFWRSKTVNLVIGSKHFYIIITDTLISKGYLIQC